MTVIAEETTTLPEGAQVSVYKVQQARKDKSMSYHVQLTALHGAKRVDMRMDNVSAGSVKLYLQLVVNQIVRERMKLTAPPLMLFAAPKDMKEFVSNMAYYGMFIFEVLRTETDANNHTTTTEVVEGSESLQEQSQVLPSRNGTVRRSGKAKGNRGRKKQ